MQFPLNLAGQGRRSINKLARVPVLLEMRNFPNYGHFSLKYFVLYIVSIQKSIREVAREFHFFQSLPKLFEINAH